MQSDHSRFLHSCRCADLCRRDRPRRTCLRYAGHDHHGAGAGNGTWHQFGKHLRILRRLDRTVGRRNAGILRNRLGQSGHHTGDDSGLRRCRIPYASCAGGMVKPDGGQLHHQQRLPRRSAGGRGLGAGQRPARHCQSAL